ncbi:MAG: hypothetical protein ABI448_01910 [Bacteroidia bacterium]
MVQLICITGLDGAGKNTLINLLKEKLHSVAIANIWDAMDGNISAIPFKSKHDIDTYLCELTPDARLLFFAHALKYAVDKAIHSGKKYILLNAYYYKYFTTELVLGASPELISILIASFPKPDKIIYLELSVEEAANRKDKLSRYECGLNPSPDKSTFISFQLKVKEKWDEKDKAGWIILNALQTPTALLNECLKIILP